MILYTCRIVNWLYGCAEELRIPTIDYVNSPANGAWVGHNSSPSVDLARRLGRFARFDLSLLPSLLLLLAPALLLRPSLQYFGYLLLYLLLLSWWNRQGLTANKVYPKRGT